jgi:hypothetical protein
VEENGPVKSTKESEHQGQNITREGIYSEGQVLGRSGLSVDFEHGNAWAACVFQLEIVLPAIVHLLLAEYVCVPVDSVRLFGEGERNRKKYTKLSDDSSSVCSSSGRAVSERYFYPA